MKQSLLWLRWSWRDLRHRWLQVLAIALIIALGTGTYSGLISTSAWREESNDASYEKLNMYDLRFSLTEGSFLEEEALREAAGSIDHAGWITALEPRLILPTLVDASTGDQTLLFPGRIVSLDVSAGGPQVNDVYPTAGRGLNAADDGQLRAILEHKFAVYYDLPLEGRLRLSGDRVLDYVGTGLAPESFMVMSDDGGMMAESSFAILFAPLSTVQAFSGREGLVNDLLLRLSPEADPAMVEQEMSATVEELGGVGMTVLRPEDDPVYFMLYDDIYQDEKFWRWMAYIFLAGAVFGAFNLATRLVEAQRREIGIQMALGVRPRRIAIRPLLVAGQIAILGVLLGLGIGLLLGRAFGGVMESMVPLPVFVMPFQSDIFLQGAVLGLALPMLATLLPVIRALRVEPVEAIATGHLVAKGGGLAPRLTSGRRSGRVLARMPLRNVLRAPRRALMTTLGIAAAITLLVLVMSMLDSFKATLDAAEAELIQDEPRRMILRLDSFYPADAAAIAAVGRLPEVGSMTANMELGSTLKQGESSIDIVLDLVDMSDPIWRPTLAQGQYPDDGPGLILAAKAARDLGLQVGDTVTLRHPQRTGLFSYVWTESQIEISGFHALPLRSQAYLPLDQAGLMGLEGLVNTLQVVPAAGFSQDELTLALFNQAGVASVQPVTAVIKVFDELIGEFVSMFVLIEAAAVVLAVLMAYNSASISLDERTREVATMFAFGLPVRTVLRVVMVETLLTSLAGTILGCGLGLLLQWFMLRQVFSSVIQDVDTVVTVFPVTLVTAGLIGILVAILTPLLNARKLTTMDIPAALRVME